MNELEKYIKEYAGAFDTEDLPSGHLERFEAKLDAGLSRRRTVTLDWRRLTLAIAAAAAVLLVIGIQSGKLWMAGAGNDPAAVYSAYSDRTASLYDRVLPKDYDGSMENALRSIAEENVPLIDQLPDEMDKAAKAAILREYYGELLEGARKVSKSR